MIKKWMNPELKELDVRRTKTWNDANNKDGIRPKAIKVKLLANGKEKTSVITTEEQEWKYSFTKLPKYDDDGKEIKYTVDEENVRGYTKKIDGYDITNTHTPTEKLDFSLRKFNPTSLKRNNTSRIKHGTVSMNTLAKENTQSYTFLDTAIYLSRLLSSSLSLSQSFIV